MIILYLSILVLFGSKIENVACWDGREMQLFDLVEEINENFYSYLGVDQNATTAEIRRSYRKLSLKYHPDRNPSEDDTKKFTKIVAIYEVLKDDKMRERYDEILKFGLPDWRMPVFYYRKLRKMSFTETFLLFALLATVIHYACLWGIYVEHRLNMDDFLKSKLRKKKIQDRKNKRSGKEVESLESDVIPTPKFKDILPFALVKLTYSTIIYTPSTVKQIYFDVKHEILSAVDKKFEKTRKAKEIEEEKKRIEEDKRLRKERKLALSKELGKERRLYEEARKNAMSLPVESFTDIPVVDITAENSENFKQDDWNDEDTLMVVRALVKYPSGVKDRWNKISEMVKRPISLVMTKIKEIQKESEEGRIPIKLSMQNSLGDGVNTELEKNVLIVSPFEDPDDINMTQSDAEDDFECMSSAQRKKKRKKSSKNKGISNVITKPDIEINDDNNSQDEEIKNEDTTVVQRKKGRKKPKYLVSNENDIDQNPTTWSQQEQKQLEDAIRLFPKGTSERWDRIAQKVPSKTKAQCIERIKVLSDKIQKKSSNIETEAT